MARRRPPSRRRRLGKTAGTSPKYSRWTRRWPYPAAGGEGEIRSSESVILKQSGVQR